MGSCFYLPCIFAHVCMLKTPFPSTRLSFLVWKVDINKNIRANMVDFPLQTKVTLTLLIHESKTLVQSYESLRNTGTHIHLQLNVQNIDLHKLLNWLENISSHQKHCCCPIQEITVYNVVRIRIFWLIIKVSAEMAWWGHKNLSIDGKFEWKPCLCSRNYDRCRIKVTKSANFCVWETTSPSFSASWFTEEPSIKRLFSFLLMNWCRTLAV